ncbi:MAG: peptidylprolyl isomerase [Pirellulaceae bacterium]
MKQVIFVLLIGVGSVIVGIHVTAAQEPSSRSSPQKQIDSAWVARLDGFTLTAADVDYRVSRTIGLVGLDETAKAAARAEALRHLIDQRLISKRLQNDPLWIGPSQLRLVLELETARIKDAGMTLEEFLAEKKLSSDYWRLDVEWNAAWTAYLQKKFSDAELDKYFNSRRRDFDGTEVLIAQILLKDDGQNSLTLATDLKSRIDRGELTFAEAVKEHSIAPSKQNDGRVGWIGRWEPMPEAYSALAFTLQVGEIGKPLETNYGVHLLKCLEIKPGKKMFRDALDEVRRSIAQTEFEDLRLAVQATQPKIEYSAEFPHFDQSGKLIIESK